MLYVALLRSTFDPLTGELPREIVEERFARSLNRLIETGDYTLKDGQTTRDAAHSILLDLTREGEGDYAWLANSMDVASHRYLYRLTAPSKRSTGLKTPRKRCPARRPTASSWKSKTRACS